ncbi:MAG: SDR family NAD(P)-dependent oxidoreductase [Acidobacteria bacterium]|nr:SDR family NAD(P)-dependent oxidoreductase [Acidobacteriota bacterium]
MIFFLITGATRGIGRAIVAELDACYGDKASYLLIARNEAALRSLKSVLQGEAQVLATDFASPVQAGKVVAEMLLKIDVRGNEKVVLVNNAGVLPPVGKTGDLNGDEIENNIQVNLTAPLVLTNEFLRWADTSPNPKLIVNISSGAARFPIVCWGAYCAAKAGVDMFSRTIAEEKRPDLQVISVAPGIIETDMQRGIRDLTPEQFPLVDNFAAYKSSGSLKSPEQAAKEIVAIIENPSAFQVIASL